jgi:hypothetical protein
MSWRSRIASQFAKKAKGDPFAAVRNNERLDVIPTVRKGMDEKTRIQDQAKRLIDVANRMDGMPQGMRRYADRLSSMISPISGPDLTDLEQEVQQEMAESLGRAGVKVDSAYLNYEIKKNEYEKSNASLNQLLKARDNALKARQELIIHRSCMGLVNSGLGSVLRIWPGMIFFF